MNSVRNERILYFAIWMLIAILPVTMELWKYINNSKFEWQAVFRWWVGMVPLIVIFLIHNHLLLPRFMKKGRMKQYCFLLVLILAVYGGIQHMADKPIRKDFLGRPMPPEPPLELRDMSPRKRPSMPDRTKSMPPRLFPFPLLFKIMLAGMTLGINVAISLAFAYNRGQTNRREQENKRLQEELKYLKQQISPHFLMNILNNIHEMVEEDSKEAQNMILELSHLMRYVLYESENDMTTLSSESRFIISYVSLMKKRYVEGIVKVNMDVQEQTSEEVNMPPLLFISFIENAFKHGVSYSNGTTIDIKLKETDGKIRFSCDNTIPPTRNSAAAGGIGLSNIRRRLDLLYGDEYSLQITQDENKYSVMLIIPSR